MYVTGKVSSNIAVSKNIERDEGTKYVMFQARKTLFSTSAEVKSHVFIHKSHRCSKKKTDK